MVFHIVCYVITLARSSMFSELAHSLVSIERARAITEEKKEGKKNKLKTPSLEKNNNKKNYFMNYNTK